MGLFSNLFGKKEKKLALPEATNEESLENSIQSKREQFTKDINFVSDVKEENIEKSGYTKFVPKNFITNNPKWRAWYENPRLRNEYYGEYVNSSEGKKPQNGGALKVEMKSEGKNVTCIISCKYIERGDPKMHEYELAKANGLSYKAAMQEMDDIIALQATGIYQGDLLKKEIQRHYDSLKKMKDIKLSNIAKIIFSSTGENILIPTDIDDDKLYETRTNFDELPTKPTLTQMPIMYEQADTSNLSQEEIDRTVEDFYEFCTLAIDIGIFDRNDWNEIDSNYFLQQRSQANNVYVPKQNNGRRIMYQREPKGKRESFEKIKNKFLTDEQLEEVLKQEQDTKSRIEAINGNEISNIDQLIGEIDVVEKCISRAVNETMKKLPMKLEEYILRYESKHNNIEYAAKNSLLNDMVIYSKIKFLQEKGLYRAGLKVELDEKEQE